MGTVFQKCLIVTILLLLSLSASAQTAKTAEAKDTLSLYKKIKKVAYKHRFTILLYHGIFVEPSPKVYETKPLSDNQKKEDPNLKYEGKYIRNINILVYDPFGYSVNDTTVKKINPFQKLGNHYHVSTRHRIIRNLLLFKKNDKVELLVINESERIVRDAGYINDSKIYIKEIEDSPDSVDILVAASDKWTLDASVSGSFSGGHVTLRERNILGSGQRYSQYVGYDFPTEAYDYNGNYIVENIKNSFVTSSLHYRTTRDLTSAGFSLNRPFYSALAKWAGGVSFGKNWGTYILSDTVEKTEQRFRLDYTSSDVWIAKNFNPGTGKRFNRRNINIVTALRFSNVTYQSKPDYSIDTAKVNFNSSFYLGSFGFSLRKYYKDQYIYRFGANEDVPEGLVIQTLYGILYKELNLPRYYFGFEVSRGKHFEKVGYLSTSMVYGSFYNKSVYKDATVNLGVYYFSNLCEINKWYFRQFVNYKFIYGFNRSPADVITLRSDEMYGFNPGSLKGTKKMILNLETVSYAPYNFIGFRFAPLLLISCGILETQQFRLLKSPVYQAYALGLLIRNENLLNASFEVTYGLYPNQPDNARFYKFNPVVSFTLKVRNFAISRPEIVSYY
ncbi:MAG: hypothetical protein V4608_07895 [Bacteroidota bacterium]